MLVAVLTLFLIIFIVLAVVLSAALRGLRLAYAELIAVRKAMQSLIDVQAEAISAQREAIAAQDRLMAEMRKVAWEQGVTLP